MKAIVQDTYGSPDVLEFQDIEKPAVQGNDVLVRVHAAGVDPGIWHLVAGKPYLVRLAVGLRTAKVRVRGMDVAGRVEAVGKDVTTLKPGDEVFGICGGAFAEYACARADRLALKPANLSFEQAAVVPISAVTALTALRDRGKVQAGQRVLIIGAAGGVGTFAVQLAKAFGAHVTGVCGTGKAELVRSIGADEIIDYTRDEFADGKHHYDLVVDTAGNRSLSHLRRALTPKGTLVMVGGEGGGRWIGAAMARTFRSLILRPFVRHNLRGVLASVGATDLQTLREIIEDGKVTPVIDRTYPLNEAPDAIRYIHNGHARGKVVLTV
jgi:NADPH:quinone reductase-like Zn-dependent oxidoreductase